jgi:hypothetical protein
MKVIESFNSLHDKKKKPHFSKNTYLPFFPVSPLPIRPCLRIDPRCFMSPRVFTDFRSALLRIPFLFLLTLLALLGATLGGLGVGVGVDVPVDDRVLV